MRPKLKDYVFFAPLEDRAFFRSPAGEINFHGPDTYRWLERIAPYLNGKYTSEDICRGLDEKRRAKVELLIQQLMDAGLARDADLDGTTFLSDQEIQLYASSLAYLEQYHTSPRQAFAQLRAARVLVVGDGPGLVAATQALAEFGFRHLSISTESRDTREMLLSAMARSLEQDATSEWHLLENIESPPAALDFDAVSYVGQHYADPQALQLLAQCEQSQIVFLNGGAFRGQIYVGPLTRPASPGCAACAAIRLGEGLNQVESQQNAEESFGSVHASVLGYVVAYWLFCSLANLPIPEQGKGLLRIDIDTFTTETYRLLPWPCCPYCGPKEAQEDEQDLMASYIASQEAPTVQDFSQQVVQLINDSVGILGEVNEGTFEQLPLYQMHVTVRGLAGTSVENTDLIVPATDRETALYLAQRAGLAAYASWFVKQPRTRWWTPAGLPSPVADVPFSVFVTGLTYWEWLGIGLLELTRKYCWMAPQHTIAREPLDLSQSALQKASLYLKMLHIRFSVPIEAFLLQPCAPYTGAAVALYSHDTLLDICVDTEPALALERGLIRVLQAIHNAQREESSLSLLTALKNGLIHDLPLPAVEWMAWTKANLEQFQLHGFELVVQPVQIDAVGLYTGWVGVVPVA